MVFSYVQIGAKDIDSLVKFYENVLEFKEVDDKTFLNGLEGKVYEAPGFSNNENKVLFGFIKADSGKARAINDRGFAHIAFETNDVKACVKRLVDCGGTFQSTLNKPEGKPCVYCKDIEGNIVEFHIPFISEDCKALKTLMCLAHLKADKNYKNHKTPSSLKFIHVNSITDDYRQLCDFYNNAFASKDTGKIKDHSGSFKEKVIGIENVHVLGKHVLLPNFYLSYPTIEIFEYSIKGDNNINEPTNLGINMIGFKSENIDEDVAKIVSFNGSLVTKYDDNKALVKDSNGSYILLVK